MCAIWMYTSQESSRQRKVAFMAQALLSTSKHPQDFWAWHIIAALRAGQVRWLIRPAVETAVGAFGRQDGA